MAKRRKRKLVFRLEHRGKREFQVGTITRFQWPDVYRALQVLIEEVVSEELRLVLTSVIASDRTMIQTHLFEVLQALEYDASVLKPRVQAAGWIIACYGYIRGLPTLKQDGSSTNWPLPRPLKRVPKCKFYDWRAELKCPICGKPFTPPKRYKSKDVILKWFASKISKHLELECGGKRNG